MEKPTCSVSSCEKSGERHGYCRAHHRRLKLYGDPEGKPESRRRFCDIDDCGKPAEGRGMCSTHYRRWYRNGDPRDYGSRIHGDDLARFWSYVNKGSAQECWDWTGPVSPDGYGVLLIQREWHYMPRFSYGLHVEPMPEGLEPDHLCRNRACVNPAHLEPVTHRVNVLRGLSPTAVNARKTHCIRGHALDEQNTRINKHGRRSCRTCKKMHDRMRYQNAA